jgi:hypothetical protein
LEEPKPGLRSAGNDSERFAEALATFVAEIPPAHLTSRDLLDEAADEPEP